MQRANAEMKKPQGRQSLRLVSTPKPTKAMETQELTIAQNTQQPQIAAHNDAIDDLARYSAQSQSIAYSLGVKDTESAPGSRTVANFAWLLNSQLDRIASRLLTLQGVAA